MIPAHHRRGLVALPVALLMLVVLGAVSATVSSQARVEITLGRHRMVAAQALAAVDACVSAIVASRSAGWDFARDGWGPDERNGTTDDGQLAAAPDCTARATNATDRLVVLATARVPDGARTIEAVIARTVPPAVPTPLWASSVAALTGFQGVITLDSTTHPTLAAPAEPDDLDLWLAAHPNVSAGAHPGPPHFAPPPPLLDLAARARPLGAAAGTALTAGPPTPQVAFVDGDLLIDLPVRGAGLLVVTGQVKISTSLDYDGVIAATGGLQIDPTATLTLRGALWLAPPTDIRGQLAITYDLQSLATADALLSLPRPAQLLSLHDREP